MTPERWAEIKRIVGEAMDAPVAGRAALIQRACGTDAELRAEVESILAEAGGAGDSISLPNMRGAIASTARAVVADRDETVRVLLGKALGHQYDILRPLGHGGMATVYLARERALERFVAIKVLRPDLAGAAESRERFRREARVAAQLSHPGILPLHTFGEVSGMWYYVMGYVRGESLADRLRLEGRVPPAQAIRMLTELADALDCAHRHGVIHRDIKPANILLDAESGRAMLADFGIARIAGGDDSLTETGAVVGTPDYMSPEQASGTPVDERTDIYSLGAVGYAMLGGRVPFTGGSAAELMHRRVTQDAPPLQSVEPSVPEALASVIMRCLERRADARWQDARTLKHALTRAGGVEGEPIPDSLRDLPGFGPYALLWALAWGYSALHPDRAASERALLLLIASLVPVGLFLHVWNVGRGEYRPMELVRMAYWPPGWWGMWWPRPLRRPTDLWPRLPWPARFVRAALSAFFFAVPGTILVRQWLIDSGRLRADDPAHEWIIGIEVAIVLGAAAVVVLGIRWARGKGLALRDAVRLLFGATTASPTWKSPAFARLLAPVARAVRQPERDAPADHARAIGELIAQLKGETADVAGTAAAMADRVLRAIEVQDRELAVLSRDASASEVHRLTSQLAALGAPAPGETREQAELRDLVRHQLEVVHRMRARSEVATAHRARLFELLRELWRQLCAACDDSGGAPGEPPSSRVRALCAAIARELDDPERPPADAPGSARPLVGTVR